MKVEQTGKFIKDAPDQLRIKEGGGCISLFGLPFFIAGIFATLIGLGVIQVENESEFPYWSRLIIIAMGLIFTCVGGILVFGRKWITIDKSRGVILKYWGLIVPMKQKEMSLYLYDGVLIKLKSGDSNSADTYTVELRAKDGSKGLDLYNSANYGNSHEQAIIIAEFLQLPVIDNSTEHEAVLDSHLQGKSSIDGAYESQQEFISAPKPDYMRSIVEETMNETRIIIPDKQYKYVKLIKYIFPLLVLIFIVPQFVSFLRQTNTPEPFVYVFISMIIIIFIVIPFISLIINILRSKNVKTVVIINSEGISIDYSRLAGEKSILLPKNDILGIDYSTTSSLIGSVQKDVMRQKTKNPLIDYSSQGYTGNEPRWVNFIRKIVKSKGIIIKTRTDIITFGAGLDDEEVVYLYGLVRKRLRKV